MKRTSSVVATALIALALSTGTAFRTNAQECDLGASEVFTELSPSVVEIFSLSINPFLVSGRVTPRGGTGFLVDDCLIVTNYHVVAGAHEIVAFDREEAIPAKILGADPSLDLAVLAPWWPIDRPAIVFSSDRTIEIGEPVFALGYPMGLGESITQGIVSGVSRVLPRTTSSWLSPYIQTDAAISPGSSGGPLVDACGKVIGVMTAGIAAEGAQNLGFAIPAAVVEPIVDELIEKGYVARPWHGLYGQITTPAILQMLGVPPDEWDASVGFLVETIEPGSAADLAGLLGGTWPVMWGGAEIILGGDIITELDGVRIDTWDKALAAVRELTVGSRVEVTYLRGGTENVAEVVIEERPLLGGELEIYRARKQ